jgi:hypothetical protein
VTKTPDWVPEGVEVNVPNVARMYDYVLGGYHNFAVDREFAEQIEKLAPGSTAIARANRAFVRRSVRWLMAAGIRQFLDIGSGIPTLGTVHEIAQSVAPESKVVYVDVDPVAVAHSKAILAGNSRAEVLRADIRQPAEILDDDRVTALLDFGQPVAVLLNAVLHFVSDADDPAGIIGLIRQEMVGGSYLTITHGNRDGGDRNSQTETGEVLDRTPTSIHLRGADELAALVAGMEVVEPGIVPVTDWHPEPDNDDSPQPGVLAVVARQP